MRYFSTMTLEEELKYTGGIAFERLLCALEKSTVAADDIYPVLKEVSAQFPDEDFLSPVTARLRILAKYLRGANKREVMQIVEQLDDIAMNTHLATEYALSEMESLKKELDKL